MWATGQIIQVDRQWIDAEVMVQRGMNFTEMDGTIGDFRSVAVGCTDDLTCSESTACDQAVADVRPVISASFRINPRCSTKFTPCHDGHISIHATFVKVGDQRMHSLIEQRKMGILTFAEIA